jgi:hypothetical protein
VWMQMPLRRRAVQSAFRSILRKQSAGDHVKWFVEHAFVLAPAQVLVVQNLASYTQLPPQKPWNY